jgi:adenylate cyclase
MSDHKLPVEPAHLETLYEITRYLNSSLDLHEVLDYLMDQVVTVTGAERGFLMLIDEETESLRFQVARGMNRQDLETPEFEVSTTIIREVVNSQKPLLTFNAEYEDQFRKCYQQRITFDFVCADSGARRPDWIDLRR